MLATATRPLALALAPAGAAWRTALVVLGAALMALAAQIQVPLPFSPVPVTGQTFAVLLNGAALGSRLGPTSVGLYVVAGAAGLPVFAGGAAGLTRLSGPTGGYLVGFVVAAYVVGMLAERGAWLARFGVAVGVLEAGLYPFIPGDVYKLVLAALALPAGWRLVRR